MGCDKCCKADTPLPAAGLTDGRWRNERNNRGNSGKAIDSFTEFFCSRFCAQFLPDEKQGKSVFEGL